MPYSLTVRALTADLGAHVTGSTTGTLAANGKAIYRLAAPVAGSLEIQLTTNTASTGV